MMVKDKVAIITGAGQGIGRAYALRFAQEGAKVIIADINHSNAQKVVNQIKEKGGEAFALQTDVSQEKDTIDMAQKTVERYGRIDAIINNAAIMADAFFKPFSAISVEDWDRVMTVNLRGTWLCSKAVFPYMQAQGKGKIINISAASVFFGLPMTAAYTASKGGIMALTRVLARELGDHGITVNCLSMGWTMSEGGKKVSEMGPPGLAEIIAGNQCIKRIQQPEDVVGTALFLCSDLSDFMTGQLIEVDGGLILH